MLISLPRLIKKDAEFRPGCRYINMEEKIQEYLTHHLANNMCFLFMPRTHQDITDQDYLTNRVEDIIAEVATVRPHDVLVKVINKQFFDKYNGRIAVRICSLASETNVKGEFEVAKIVRFEAAILQGGQTNDRT